MPGTRSVCAGQEKTPPILPFTTPTESDQRPRACRQDAPALTNALAAESDRPTTFSVRTGGVSAARVSYTYNALGLRATTNRYADAAGTALVGSSTYSYDALGQLTDLVHQDGSQTVLASYEYAYDPAGLLASETDDGQITTYQNDATGQLTNATHPGQPNESYSYDANGNRVGGGYVVGPNNEVLSDGTFTYSYDAEGNQISKKEITTGATTTYTYDFRNRLVGVEEYDGSGNLLHTIGYTYDVFDRRIAKTVDGQRTSTVYNGLQVWADYDATGAVTARYLTGSKLDEMVARWRPSDGTAWYLTDHLGTVRDIANATGAVVDHLSYDSFGNVVAETNPAAGDRFRFTGQQFDAETGLYYDCKRYYAPRLGRFMSQDPLAFEAGDINLYRYTANNPVGASDPLGLTEVAEEDELETRKVQFTAREQRVLAAAHLRLTRSIAALARAEGELAALEGPALGLNPGEMIAALTDNAYQAARLASVQYAIEVLTIRILQDEALIGLLLTLL